MALDANTLAQARKQAEADILAGYDYETGSMADLLDQLRLADSQAIIDHFRSNMEIPSLSVSIVDSQNGIGQTAKSYGVE